MILIHAWVARKGNQSGMVRLFKGIIFQITRLLQLALQMNDDDQFEDDAGWRPFVLAISPDSFKRKEGYDMVRWIAHRYGFGTYMHFIKVYEQDMYLSVERRNYLMIWHLKHKRQQHYQARFTLGLEHGDPFSGEVPIHPDYEYLEFEY